MKRTTVHNESAGFNILAACLAACLKLFEWGGGVNGHRLLDGGHERTCADLHSISCPLWLTAAAEVRRRSLLVSVRKRRNQQNWQLETCLHTNDLQRRWCCLNPGSCSIEYHYMDYNVRLIVMKFSLKFVFLNLNSNNFDDRQLKILLLFVNTTFKHGRSSIARHQRSRSHSYSQ